MHKIIILITIFICRSSVFPQSFEFVRNIGSFANASSFSISSLGFIYVSDLSSNSVYKIDTLGNILKEIGGFGWDGDQFDTPSHIISTIINVYVTDRNNNRIQIFDKNLNLVSILTSKAKTYNDPGFSFPVATGISKQGDIFILDSDNKVVLKYDLLGNYSSSFGGLDAGNNSLANPTIIFVTFNNEILVIDDRKEIKVFDTFGNFVRKESLPVDITGINGVFDNMTLNSKNRVFIPEKINSLKSLKEVTLSGIGSDEDFVSSILFNNVLFILTENSVLVFYRKGE